TDERHKLPYHVYSRIKYNRMGTLIDYIKKRSAIPCLYFAFSRRRCEELAQEISYQDLLTGEERTRVVALFEDLAAKFNLSSGHADFLFSLVKRGIAYHHAGLLPTLKEIIEQLFASGLIKLIFTTETFALGINMPARTVVFDTVSKFYGRGHAYLKVRDLYQMAGRAGRRGIDTEGYVIIKASAQVCDIAALQNMMYGAYEPITSQLNSRYATILNLYKLMGDKIYDIYPRSFHFHQATAWEKKEAVHLLGRKMTLLESLRYIADGSITWKADLASKVYSFELQMGELFENGFWESLDARALFIIIVAMVYEPRKGEGKPQLSKPTKRFKKDLNKFVGDIHREERRMRIFPLSKKFYFYLSEAAGAWFDGAGFERLEKLCGVDEGEIVRNFRMSIQVLREMLTSQIISEPLKMKITHCLRRVNRDVVDAEKQLRQEL
ncbi:MAG: hypothetical protein KKF80_06495, partial [Candidatus Omnitrophica bacterium]|nr:hypothetical protein [Candidatus Omnitrophota bacterium]